MLVLRQKKTIWLALLLLVVSSNVAIYQTGLFHTLDIEQNPQVVLGSLLDLIIVAPILALCYLKKYSWKIGIGLVAAGCVIARLVIPSTLLSPYQYVTTAGIAVELAIIVFEMVLIVLLILYLPKIVRQVRASTAPLTFAFPQAVNNFSKNPVVNVLASEMLVFYYAFASWKQQTPNGITLYKNTSFMAMQVMIIHAIILESLGFHWWLHSKAPVLSIILLLLNVYGLIFILANIRSTKLSPIQLEQTGFYISIGIMKRTYIDYRDIDEILTNVEVKSLKRYVDFVVQEFETLPPQIVLKMKSPQRVDFLYGIRKDYDYVGIKCDDLAQLLAAIEKGQRR